MKVPTVDEACGYALKAEEKLNCRNKIVSKRGDSNQNKGKEVSLEPTMSE